MLVVTGLIYVGLVVMGQSIDRWWGWVIAWIGLTMCMLRIDAVHHEAIHRSLYVHRFPNDLIGCFTGAIEGFHGPTYRCFHLAHHALTRRDDSLADPEGFYDETADPPALVRSPASRGSEHIGRRRVDRRSVVRLATRRRARSPPARPAACVCRRRLTGTPRATLGPRAVRSCGRVPLLQQSLTGHTTICCAGGSCRCSCSCAARTRSSPCRSTTPRRTTTRWSPRPVPCDPTPFYRWLTLDGNFHLAHHVFPNVLVVATQGCRCGTAPCYQLRYRGYVAFHRIAWNNLAPSTASDSAAPAM